MTRRDAIKASAVDAAIAAVDRARKRRVALQRRAQGLPPTVTDLDALDDAAGLLVDARDRAAREAGA